MSSVLVIGIVSEFRAQSRPVVGNAIPKEQQDSYWCWVFMITIRGHGCLPFTQVVLPSNDALTGNLEHSGKIFRVQRLVMLRIAYSLGSSDFSKSNLPTHQIDCPKFEISCSPCLRNDLLSSIPASFKASPIFELVGCASPNRMSYAPTIGPKTRRALSVPIF